MVSERGQDVVAELSFLLSRGLINGSKRLKMPAIHINYHATKF